MRVRTAVTIVAAFVVVKGALTVVALTAWTIIPERRWPVDHLHIELGPLAEWLAGFAAAGAAAVALWIATRDRQDRTAERQDEEKMHARLVRLTADMSSRAPCISVEVRNNGPMAILDVALTGATWGEHPDARWGTNGLSRENLHHAILQPDSIQSPGTRAIWFTAWFMHPTDERSLIEVLDDNPYDRKLTEVNLATVNVRIQFTSANGVRWEQSTSGEPVRLS